MAGIQVFMVVHGLYLYFESPTAIRARRRLYIVLSVVICVLNSYGVITEIIEMQYVFSELRAPGASVHYMETAARWWMTLGSVCIILAHLCADGLLVSKVSPLLSAVSDILCSCIAVTSYGRAHGPS